MAKKPEFREPTAAEKAAYEKRKKIQDAKQAKRSARTKVAHANLKEDKCPECETPVGKHDRNRPQLVECSKCKHLFHTYPRT